MWCYSVCRNQWVLGQGMKSLLFLRSSKNSVYHTNSDQIVLKADDIFMERSWLSLPEMKHQKTVEVLF